MEAKPYKIPYPFKKLNQAMIDRLVDKIAKGSTHKLASLSSGITPRIFDMWRKQGEVDLEFEVDSLCATLVLSLSHVKELEVVSCRADIRASDKGHKGAEWTLEHAYWRDFGPSAALIEMDQRLKDIEQNQAPTDK